jgi:diaminopimelate epimerase
MKFSKLQATGNDFILLDARRIEEDWAGLARKLCQRHFGIGADGLILVQNSSVADIKMRIFNSDGSEAEACGNGLRCTVRYAISVGICQPRSILPNVFDLSVETIAGMRRARAHILREEVKHVEVDMGRPQLRPEQIPVNVEVNASPILQYSLEVGSSELQLAVLSMGNPHAVAFISSPVSQFALTEVGPKVEEHPIFPRRVNFEVVRVLSEDEVEVRVWERGVGETLSCGSGACAVVVAANLLGYVGRRVNVNLPGGQLTVSWDGDGEVWLDGLVEEVFHGEWHQEGDK